MVVVIFESLLFIYTLSLIPPRSAYGDVLAIKEALYEIVVVVLGKLITLSGVYKFMEIYIYIYIH